MTKLETADSSTRSGALSRKLWDVLVVGAGPAGATAAAEIASQGYEVLLVDKHQFPREKPCGDGLIPDALKSLKSLGLYDSVRRLGHAVGRLVIVSPSGIRIEVPTECITLRREQLDQLILDTAVERGAEFEIGTVTDIRQEPNGEVTAALNSVGGRRRARIAVIATGANVSLLQALGMLHRSRASGMALRCYVKSSFELDHLLVSYQRSIAPGYAWVFPLGNNEYNIGCGVFYTRPRNSSVNLREVFSTFVAKSPVAKPLMQDAESVTPLRGARLRSGLEGAAFCNGESVVAIGETAGATYPFTGEGIGKAMETGAIAGQQVCKALQRGDFAPIHHLSRLFQEQLSPRYSGYTVAQRWLSRPWLSDLLAARISTSKRLRQTAANILSETADPRAVFSWRILLPAWASSKRRSTRA
jgi:geranylgeranyl reductase family protein